MKVLDLLVLLEVELVNHCALVRRQLSGIPLSPHVSSPSIGIAHSSCKVSLQPYTVTDANALSGNECSWYTMVV